MTSRRIFGIGLLTLCAATGLMIALLAFPSIASAWNWRSLPSGYSTSAVSYTDENGNACQKVSIDGHYMGDTCTDPGGLAANVDAYVNSTICSVNPAAGGSQCVTTTAPTTTAQTTTSDTTTTTSDPGSTGGGSTTTADAPAGGGASAATTPGQPPATTVTVTTADTDLAARVTALEQRLDTDEARIEVLASHTTVLGEVKSELPFIRPAAR
jgi:hypothetical protein